MHFLAGRRRAVAPLLLVVALLSSACSDPSTSDDVSYLAGRSLVEFDGDERELDLFEQAVPLGAVERPDGSLGVVYSDRLVIADRNGDIASVMEFEPPAFGVEIAPGENGFALTVVTTPLGDIGPHTRVLWIGAIELLFDDSQNLALVGVIEEGVVVRDTAGGNTISVLGWDATQAGLGLSARDALVIPHTRLIAVSGSTAGAGQEGTAVLDLDTGGPTEITGLPTDAIITQAVAAPVGPLVALALRAPDEDQTQLWVIDGIERLATRVDIEIHDEVLGGFTDDAEAVVLVTDGSRFEGELVAVELADGTVREVDLPANAVPIGWTRTVVSLASIRDDPSS